MSKFLLGYLYFLFALSGARSAAVPQGAPIDLLINLTIATVATMWSVQDSRALGEPIPRSFDQIIFLTWPLAVPIYLIWSRKKRGLLLVVVHGALLSLTTVMAFIAVSGLLFALRA